MNKEANSRLSVEELLNPRCKCIAPYPGSKFEIGEVMDFEDFEFWTNGDDPNKYPANFKILEWWEERDAEDMPRYLKHTLDGETTYHKIVKWDINILFGYVDIERRSGCGLTLWKPEYSYQPASQEDYEAYINTKHT